MTEFVTGDEELDRRLRVLGGRIAEKAIASGIRAGLAEMRKAMRAKVANPRARMTIASRFKRKKKQGVTEAKVGASVGKHKAASASRGRPGVGISKQNAHWYFLGTKQRVTRAGANRGAMPGHDAVRRGGNESQGAAMSALRRKVKEVMEKEVGKLR